MQPKLCWRWSVWFCITGELKIMGMTGAIFKWAELKAGRNRGKWYTQIRVNSVLCRSISFVTSKNCCGRTWGTVFCDRMSQNNSLSLANVHALWHMKGKGANVFWTKLSRRKVSLSRTCEGFSPCVEGNLKMTVCSVLSNAVIELLSKNLTQKVKVGISNTVNGSLS